MERGAGAGRGKIVTAATAAFSIAALIAALQYPLYKADFALPTDRPVLAAVLSSENVCSRFQEVTDAEQSFLSSVCTSVLEPYTDLFLNEALSFSLGPVEKHLSWEECRELEPENLAESFNGALMPGSPIERCVKLTIANLLGIQLGNTKLVDVLKKLYASGDILLFSTVLLFGIIFPLAKILSLSLAASVAHKEEPRAVGSYLGVAHALGKWSMTDVFVVSILVVNLKLNALGMQIETQAGLYFLFLSGLVSSIGIHFMLSELKRIPHS